MAHFSCIHYELVTNMYAYIKVHRRFRYWNTRP